MTGFGDYFWVTYSSTDPESQAVDAGRHKRLDAAKSDGRAALRRLGMFGKCRIYQCGTNEFYESTAGGWVKLGVRSRAA